MLATALSAVSTGSPVDAALGSTNEYSQIDRLYIGADMPTAILVRHADVTGTGDPPLNVAGQARAGELRRVLGDAGVGAIFVSPRLRTQQTAAPLAAQLGIASTVLADADATVAAIRGLPASAVALVVGHTDTLPAIASGVGSEPLPAIGATEFSRLFVLTRGRLMRLRYGA
jgi:phosphohistidine phosphatase SixA